MCRWCPHLRAGCCLAALQELGQRVPQLVQLEQLAVQQLQQGAQAPAKGFPLQLAALHPLLQIAQLGLQRLVPQLHVLTKTQHLRFTNCN